MFKKDYRKHSNPLVVVFRIIWSIVIIIILGIGLIQAYKSFSGYDPLKINPQESVKGLLSSDAIYKFFTSLLTFNPATISDKAQDILREDKKESDNPPDTQRGDLEFKFAVIADSHKDTADLEKALDMAKSMDAKFVIGIGDFSDVGTIDELLATKKQFDAVNLPYYVTAGDRDIWDSRNKNLNPLSNFNQVFGSPYQAFSYNNVRLMLVYDADNYLGLDELQLKWVEDELSALGQKPSKLFFIFTATPLFHPSSDHFMGKLTPKLRGQADHLISILKRAGADEVFAADTHFFSRYQEPESNLKMTTVGALTSERNPQAPRFAIVDVYANGSYNVEEIEIK